MNSLALTYELSRYTISIVLFFVDKELEATFKPLKIASLVIKFWGFCKKIEKIIILEYLCQIWCVCMNLNHALYRDPAFGKNDVISMMPFSETLFNNAGINDVRMASQ